MLKTTQRVGDVAPNGWLQHLSGLHSSQTLTASRRFSKLLNEQWTVLSIRFMKLLQFVICNSVLRQCRIRCCIERWCGLPDVTKVDVICDIPRARINVNCRSLHVSLLFSLVLPHVMSNDFLFPFSFLHFSRRDLESCVGSSIFPVASHVKLT
ncbi:hypothetical protein DL98DRAFT_294208 [Cadophora sp. DSE1049]|nr:hypothetical protein DL98DRAFT_294208 [Cadophora sp. DSE1049]